MSRKVQHRARPSRLPPVLQGSRGVTEYAPHGAGPGNRLKPFGRGR